MKRSISLLLLAAMLTVSCTPNKDKVKAILEANGLTNIELTGYQCFACSDEDDFNTGFTATGQNGTEVKGVVCVGLLKGYTIRYK